jgi:hypothetical protein
MYLVQAYRDGKPELWELTYSEADAVELGYRMKRMIRADRVSVVEVFETPRRQRWRPAPRRTLAVA